MRVLAGFVAALLLASCGWSPSPPPPPPPAGGLWQDAAIFRAVASVLASAHGRVLVEMYEFGRADLAADLVAAHGRGADVRLVLDPTVPVTVATGRRLKAAGLPVRFYPVDDRAGQIDHVKLLLGDGVAVVGGMNWGASSDHNHDYALVLTAPPELSRLTAIFDQDWSLAGGVPRPLSEIEGDVAQTAPGHEIRQLLTSTIQGAGTRIEAEVFDLTDIDLLLQLQLAERRGVAVRVLLDSAQEVNKPTFNALLVGQVPVRWSRSPPGAKLHAKAVLVDGRLILGSANWSLHGLGVNHELDVSTTDPRAVAAYGDRFEADWARSG